MYKRQDPEAILAEIEDLEARGFSVAGRFFVSQIAHMVMPYHKALEKASEESKDGVKIGTTGRGIGPAYRDKVERSYGVRVMDLLDPARLRDKLRAAIDHPESRSKLFYEATDTFMSMWGGMGSLTDFYIASAPSGELEARQDEYHTLALALSDFFRAHS